MTKAELAELGISEQDVLNRLVERLVERLIDSEEEYSNDFQQRMEKAIKARVDETLTSAMEKHILPNVSAQVESITLQETTRWGEAKGAKVSFIEYLTQRVDAYIREEVNHNGKSRSEETYSWTKSSTRIAYMVHQHLQYSIERAMTSALGDVNSSVRKGLEEACKIALAGIKVQVNTTVKT